jgi:Pyridoxamine 5'-phosphate oxidase
MRAALKARKSLTTGVPFTPGPSFMARYAHPDGIGQRPDTMLGMASWGDFAAAEPEMAERGRALLYQRGDGEGFLSTIAANGTPRIHPLNVGVVDGRLLVFVQNFSAKARDLAANPHYALHAHQAEAHPDEFLVRGEARLVTDAAIRTAAAGQWFFTVSDDYPLYELHISHALLGQRQVDEWPPRYRSWRSR